ncbi:MAG: hydrogenase maturation nickel metallochaperone HypA [Chloroflexota bacterium]
MHELSITESVLRLAMDEATKHGASRVTLIRLKVGEMTQVEPDSVQFYLDVLAKGTIAEGVKLAVDRVPLRARCATCGDEFGVSQFAFACPGCGGTRTEIVSGRELFVDSIEVE